LQSRRAGAEKESEKQRKRRIRARRKNRAIRSFTKGVD
jgi:hypothetical protein